LKMELNDHKVTDFTTLYALTFASILSNDCKTEI
jgi:hypothetical protein